MDSKNEFTQNPFLMQEAANKLAALGFSVIPVNYDKRPSIATWKEFQSKIADAFQINDMFPKKTYGLAIITGSVSRNLEGLDEDLKYDLTGTMHEEFVAMVKVHLPGLFEKLFIIKTRTGGYHYYYFCEFIEGNLKLASRPTSAEEQKLHPKEKQKVLYETRAEGGYLVSNPTPDYEIIQGSFDNIPTITPEERAVLHNIARSFDQCPKEYVPPTEKAYSNFKGLSPFEDYNSKGEVIALLHKHGWTTSFTKGAKTFLKRPGDTKAVQSANFDKDKNWFTSFSTSTEFEPQKAYQPYAVYAVLECGGDFTKASKQLYEAGYGERRTNTTYTSDPYFKQALANGSIDPQLDLSTVFINAVELLKNDTSENRYLLFPILPRVGTGVLAGMPDTGKSQMGRQLCICIVAGFNKFLDFDLTPIHKRALYVATEDDAQNTIYLLQQQLKGLNQEASENLIFSFADTLSQDEILYSIDKQLTALPCDIVLIDSFGDVFKGTDTNNSTAMRQTVKNFDRLAKKHNCFFLFIHHITKSGYKEAPHQMHIMGGAGLVQKVRLAMQLSQDEAGNKFLTIVKGNYCPQEIKKNAMGLTFDKDTFIFSRSGDNVARSSLGNSSDGGSNQKINKMTELAEAIFRNESIKYKTFCIRHEEITTLQIAQAKRDHKLMKELEIIIKDEDYPTLWKLNPFKDFVKSPSANSPDDPVAF